MPTGHWFSHAPHVVHCHNTPWSYTSASFASSLPESSAVSFWRISVFGFRRFPVP